MTLSPISFTKRRRCAARQPLWRFRGSSQARGCAKASLLTTAQGNTRTAFDVSVCSEDQEADKGSDTSR